MTKRWNNDEKDEKDRKTKHNEEIKVRQISTYESRNFKKIWQGERDEKMKNGQKDDKKMKRWWKDDAWLNIDN